MDRDFCGTEQQGVDLIKVPLVILKNFNEMIEKNFDDPEEIKALVDGVKSPSTKMQLIFPSYRMLKT